jgi:hypothetical protein
MTFDDDVPNEARVYPSPASGLKKWSIDDEDMWAAIRMQILARQARRLAWNHPQAGWPLDGFRAN